MSVEVRALNAVASMTNCSVWGAFGFSVFLPAITHVIERVCVCVSVCVLESKRKPQARKNYECTSIAKIDGKN